MNELEFYFDNKKVRTVLIDNEPHFVFSDVCNILEYANSSKTIEMVDEDDLTKSYIIDNLKRSQEVWVVNESGLYTLIIRSNKTEAKKFRKWVTSEVLPQIRKTGRYQKALSIEEMTKLVISDLNQKIEAQNQRINLLIHTNKLYTASEIAKELNMKSANELNSRLAALGVQYKVNNTWVLTAKYSNRGLTSIKQNELENGRIIYDRKWTITGRDFVLNLFNIGDLAEVS